MIETVKKYGSRIIIMGLFVFFIHGSKLNSAVIGIDTEKLINMQGGFYRGWLETGRQGLVGLKGFFGTMLFNPYFAGLMTLVFLTVALVSFLFLWDTASGKGLSGMAGALLAMAVWGSHPAMTEQLYFSLQSMEICAGIALTAVSLFCVKSWQRNRKRYLLPIAAFLALLVFSTYQAFVPLYIFGTVSILVLEGFAALEQNGTEQNRKEQKRKEQNRTEQNRTERNRTEQNRKDGKWLLSEMIPYLVVFLAAFLFNMVATRLFFSGSDYLEQQIVWGNASLRDILKNFLRHMIQLYTGWDSIYYSMFYGILFLVEILCLTGFLKRQEKVDKGLAGVQFFFLLSLWITPFLMTFVCGSAPAVRSQFVLPAASAYQIYLCFRLLGNHEKKPFSYALPVVLCICAAGLWGQMQTTLRLYYTEQCRYEQDVARAREMIQRIDRVQGEYPLPVAFVGKLDFQGNPSTLQGETMGHSFFEHDAQVEPASYHNTGRILGLMRILGRDYKQLPMEDMEEAWEHSYYMPGWPAENSVQRWEDMIVVKLEYWEE